jgi:hypothetical protein
MSTYGRYGVEQIARLLHEEAYRPVYASRNDGANYWFYRTKGAIGGFGLKGTAHEFSIFPLSDFDKDYVKDVKLKSGESLFRYDTDKSRGITQPLVKLNPERGLVYFLDPKVSSGEVDEPSFDSRGTRMRYCVILDEYRTGGDQ